jgi:hypothetical protein
LKVIGISFLLLSFFVQESNNFTSKLMQNHIGEVETRLRVLDLVVEPLAFVLLNVVSHELSQLLMPVQVATLFLLFGESRWNYFFAHLVLSLLWCTWQWSEVGSSSRLRVLDYLGLCLLEQLLCLVLRVDFLEGSCVCAPWHWLALISIGSFVIQRIIQSLKESIVVYILNVLVFLLRYSKKV